MSHGLSLVRMVVFGALFEAFGLALPVLAGLVDDGALVPAFAVIPAAGAFGVAVLAGVVFGAVLAVALAAGVAFGEVALVTGLAAACALPAAAFAVFAFVAGVDAVLVAFATYSSSPRSSPDPEFSLARRRD
ncbi:MAG: hypothetical protein AB7I79_14675 [Rhizobiaceae bacterium]